MVACKDQAASDLQKFNPRAFDPQVRKVQAACSGLFFEVSSQYNRRVKESKTTLIVILPDSSQDDSVARSRQLHDHIPSKDLLIMIDLYR